MWTPLRCLHSTPETSLARRERRIDHPPVRDSLTKDLHAQLERIGMLRYWPLEPQTDPAVVNSFTAPTRPSTRPTVAPWQYILREATSENAERRDSCPWTQIRPPFWSNTTHSSGGPDSRRGLGSCRIRFTLPVYSERLPDTDAMRVRSESVPSVKATIRGSRGHQLGRLRVNSGLEPSGTISL
jgi:hypothetical protein